MMRSQRTLCQQPTLVTQLRVADPVVTPGATVNGELVVETGATSARLATLSLALLTDISTGDGRLPRVLAKEPLACHITLTPFQTRIWPFSLVIPYYTPLSLGTQRVALRIVPELFCDDPGDSDALVVRPHPLMERVFSGLEELGFWLSSVDYVPLQRPALGCPYTQRFTFRPPGRFQHLTESLKLWFTLNHAGLEATLELAPPSPRQSSARAVRHQRRLLLPASRDWDYVTPRLQRLLTRRIDLTPPVTAGLWAKEVR